MDHERHINTNDRARYRQFEVFPRPLTDNSSIFLATESDDAEAKMRRALGIYRTNPVPIPHDRPPSPPPSATYTSPAFARRRFVRDGEVPVTVLNREHSHGHDVSNQPFSVAGWANRIAIAEANFHAERQARGQAERFLAEAQSTIHDLQTKLGHECLARDEAQAAYDRAKADYDAAQEALAAVKAELLEEQQARRKVERALRELLADHADQSLPTLPTTVRRLGKKAWDNGGKEGKDRQG
jgi:hypothetical protein